MPKKKAVIYARQSSGKEEESESIALQIELCRELARKRSLDIIGEYFEEKANARIKDIMADILQIESAADNASQNEERVKNFLLNMNVLMEDRLEPHVFEDLLIASITQIRCFYDYIEIDTIYGSFALKRVMEGNFRNFPTFSYNFVKNNLRNNLLNTQINVTYLYGNNTEKVLIADFHYLQIFAQY